MFTGIIECLGSVIAIESSGSNKIFTIQSAISAELKVDQSVSHDGVCLTVVEIKNDAHKVIAVDETLNRTNLSEWIAGQKINIERAMIANARFDGHFVQGHVDAVSIVEKIKEKKGSWILLFKLAESHSGLIVEKGSITINGVSLTVTAENKKAFAVAIIPYTYEHTNFAQLKKGRKVNIEFDVIGKYVKQMMRMKVI
ncbi:riboflavin synthase subunit alpha [Bacteroidota bacterium]|nr:riboflavin synthase subunit alpha [Bacteroidota bacterium]